jgi:hypothetical protein
MSDIDSANKRAMIPLSTIRLRSLAFMTFPEFIYLLNTA